MLRAILHRILRYLSKKIVKKYRPDIVGVTGSIGKSSAKEAVATVLGCCFKIRKSVKNYNNEIGVPLAIIGVDKTPGKSLLGWLVVFYKAVKIIFKKDENYPDILVLEMGADKPGDIQYLVEIAPCKVGVLTYISHAHTQFFKTIKKIAQEKRIIISHLSHDGFAVLNYDNDLVMENSGATKAEVITYGFKEGADLRATDVNFIYDEKGWPQGLNFKINFQGNIVPVFLPGAVATHLIPSALAALAVGHIFGVNLVQSAEALRGMAPMPGHMCLIPGVKETLIIDDTYNSSAEPTKSALRTLAQVKTGEGSERYAVLGDMLELGAETENAHREVGLTVAELGIDFLITVGEASKHTAQAAREAGMEEHKIASFADSPTAGRFLQEKMERGDVVLVKGSQGVRMEKIVKEIMAEPLQAVDLLVRQDGVWKNS